MIRVLLPTAALGSPPQREICGLAKAPYADGGLRRNPSSHGHYSDYYDDETREIVAEYMAADIRHFGYAFERPAAVVGLGSREK